MSFSYDEILLGYKRNPKSSPDSLYDSIWNVYNGWWESLKVSLDCDEESDWFSFRLRDTIRVRKGMDSHLLSFFGKYQEHVLIPMSGKIPELIYPIIFFKVMKDFPINIYRQTFFDNSKLGPCVDIFHKIDFGDLKLDEFYPSRRTMAEYFWRKYLCELVKKKDYPLNSDSQNKLEYLMLGGTSSLEKGYLLKWGV